MSERETVRNAVLNAALALVGELEANECAWNESGGWGTDEESESAGRRIVVCERALIEAAQAYRLSPAQEESDRDGAE